MNEIARDTPSDSTVLQVRKVGNSVGLILPKEVLAQLGIREGDKLHVMKRPDGSINLSPFDPKHARTMEIARKIMHRYRDTFAALAK